MAILSDAYRSTMASASAVRSPRSRYRSCPYPWPRSVAEPSRTRSACGHPARTRSGRGPGRGARSGGVLVDLGELVRAELEPVEGPEVVLQLRDTAGADDDRGHPRVAQRPPHRELGEALPAPARDLVERAYLGHPVLGQVAPVQEP